MYSHNEVQCECPVTVFWIQERVCWRFKLITSWHLGTGCLLNLSNTQLQYVCQFFFTAFHNLPILNNCKMETHTSKWKSARVHVVYVVCVEKAAAKGPNTFIHNEWLMFSWKLVCEQQGRAVCCTVFPLSLSLERSLTDTRIFQLESPLQKGQIKDIRKQLHLLFTRKTSIVGMRLYWNRTPPHGPGIHWRNNPFSRNFLYIWDTANMMYSKYKVLLSS